jgi:regulatory protein
VARKLPALRALPPETRSRRLVGMLGRRGYSLALAVDVVRDAMAAELPEQVADDLAGE